ncbi:hypothetical protein JCM17846_01790 [Iodidimonas nitroreducens]|uniref:Uncharacterized protein n=1 Tax=Iodidimonas nitroreducens TaxID=1236968 RepID=A0A5A7N394_9PROT|nr:hypothetical protein [Iodidimonas nitroreducens]GER02497.1 hypothetical protein JCM17846_01790 [Iodidimonas nitroreducens]
MMGISTLRTIIRRFGLLILLMAGAAGCTSLLDQSPKAPEPQASPAAPSPSSLAPNSKKGTDLASPPTPITVPQSPDPGRLLGLTAGDVHHLMGVPLLVRREDRAQMMQYKSAQCVLDIYLYEPQPGMHFRAQHVEARDLDGQPFDSTQCMAQLIPRTHW